MKVLKLIKAIVVVILAASVSAFAQQQEVKYYSKSGYKQVAPADAYYFEVEEWQTNHRYTRTRYTLSDSTKVSFYTYKKYRKGADMKDGPFYTWHENGKLASQGTFKKNSKDGEYKSWHKNGAVESIEKYNHGELYDTLRSYYPTGELRRKEAYKFGYMVSGAVYAKNGELMEYVPQYQFPEFPGGMDAMIQFIGQHLEYPEEALKKNIQGAVRVAFVVDEAGLLHDIEVVEPVYPAMDAEAIRVVSMMPTWEPGLQNGELVPVYYTLPIRFTIN